MFRNASFAIGFVSLFLLVYLILIYSNSFLNVIAVMFMISPFLLVYMVYTILRYGKYSGKELGENEEYGYEDFKKSDF